MGGISGRTGLEVARRLALEPDVEVEAAVGARSVGRPLRDFLGPGAEGLVYANVEEAFRSVGEADVYVDFTHAAAAAMNALQAPRLGMRPLLGTSGIAPEDIERLREAVVRFDMSGAIIPNFALGSLRAKRLALELARDYDEIEIIEYHGRHKRDKPSGTTRDLDESLRAMGRRAAVHSVRLSGLVAHQAVLFGSEGETITIRHDVTSRSAYAEGVLAAARALMSRKGFFLSLEDLTTAVWPTDG